MVASRLQRLCVLVLLFIAVSSVSAVRINKKHKHSVIASAKQIDFDDLLIDDRNITAPTITIEGGSSSSSEVDSAQDQNTQDLIDKQEDDDGGLSALKNIDPSTSEGQAKLIRAKNQIYWNDPNFYEEVEFCDVLSELDCVAVIIDGVERYFRRMLFKDLSKIPFDLISRCEVTLCTNRAGCKQELSDVVSCMCRPGTSGDRCEQFSESPCSSNPCRNDGICTKLLDSELGYVCVCPSGFGCARCQCTVDSNGVPHKIRPKFNGGVAASTGSSTASL